MLQSHSKKKTIMFLFMMLIAGVTSVNIRLLTDIDPNCNAYNADGSCSKCSYRFYPNKSTKLCAQVSSLCATWSDSNGSCLTCYPSYGTPINGVCSATPVDNATVGQVVGSDECDPNCQCHNDNRQCNKCYSGYQLDANYKCVAIVATPPTVDNCAKYNYIDAKGKNVAKYTNGCKVVCVQCNSGFYLNKKSQCVALPSYCKTADVSGKCTECVSGYTLTNGTCIKTVVQQPPTDNCAQYGYVDAKGKFYATFTYGCKKVCTKCKTGYYLDKTYSCVALPANCKVADASGKCTECASGYEVNNGKCVVVTVTDDHCAEYGYIDAKGKLWNKWVSGCKTICKKCDEGYQLDNGTCVQVVEVPTDNCLEYSYIDSKGKWWSKWVSDCKKVCKKCADGYYLDKSYSCVALPANCKVADAYGKCTECASGYKVNNGKCQKIVTVTPPPADNCAQYSYVDAKGKYYATFTYGCKKVCTKCKSGYYLDKTYSCVALPSNCLAADSYGKCTNCSSGYQVNSDGKCQVVQVGSDDNCAQYGYVDAKGKWYSTFIKGCKKVCKKCDEGYDLINGQCVVIVESNNNPYCTQINEDGECCACAYRTYFNEYGICTPVSDYCQEWSDETGTCTCCYTGYKLHKGDCILE